MRLDALETKDMLTQRATNNKKTGRRQRGIVVSAEEKTIFYFGGYTSQESQMRDGAEGPMKGIHHRGRRAYQVGLILSSGFSPWSYPSNFIYKAPFMHFKRLRKQPSSQMCIIYRLKRLSVYIGLEDE